MSAREFMEKRRVVFEESYHKAFGRLPQNWNEDLGKYFDAHGQGAWWSWNAALDSVEIELPEISDSSDIAWHHSDIRDAIQQQGFKVRT